MSSSLGFTHHEIRPASTRAGVLPISVQTASSKGSATAARVFVTKPRGLIPVLAYSALAFILPFLYLPVSGMDYNYSEDATRYTTIALVALTSFSVVYANCCCAWYNMVLFFHLAVEIYVIDITLRWARDNESTIEDWQYSLCFVAASIIGVHLVPFFVMDRVRILTILAFAGTIVNAATLVVIHPEFLLTGVSSSFGLLLVTMLLVGACDYGTSLLGLILKAYKEGSVIKMEPWSM